VKAFLSNEVPEGGEKDGKGERSKPLEGDTGLHQNSTHEKKEGGESL